MRIEIKLTEADKEKAQLEYVLRTNPQLAEMKLVGHYPSMGELNFEPIEAKEGKKDG